MEQEQEDELLLVREVAAVLRVDITTVRRWIAGGTLDAITLPTASKRKAYRVRRRTLNAILDGHKQETTPVMLAELDGEWQ